MNIDKKNGWVVIDKPLGMTSTQVIGKVRRIIGTKKVGHVGTLDPLASGVLPIAIGEATKTIPFLTDSTKEYIFTIFFGLETETGDLENIDSKTLESSKTSISAGKVAKILPKFIGEITQIPPKFSAIKIKGEALYKKARRGESVKVPSRIVEIKELEILEQPAPHSLTLRCLCGQGTYIRTLAEDIAKAVGEKGVVSYLHRTKSGVFSLKDSFSLEKLEKVVYNNSESLSKVNFFVPLDKVLADIPVLSITKEEEEKIRKGQKVQHDTSLKMMRLICNSNLVAIASADGEKIKSIRVFNFNNFK